MGKIRFGRVGFFIEIVIICLICGVFVLSVAIPYNTNSASAANKGSSYIVMNASDCEVMEESNSHLRLPMASTTKTMTALIVIENCRLDETVTVPAEAVGVEGSSVYLKKGDKYTVEELLYGLMLRSGNDAATALAIHTAGSVKNFVEMMNYRAETMGLNDTHFVNPHGLHDDNHYTSAYDLCKIGCFAMKNDVFAKIVGTKKVTVGKGELTRVWCNKNKILSLYDGGNGIKTGFTKAAGRCLIASAERDGVTVVSVVLNRGDMFNDCMNLMDRAFDKISDKKDTNNQ